ncbi:MAG: cytochrome c biogenesis heme-transporting ATPase CcmA [Gammaproteobacteria bacterium]|nr:cytochrome c biogenesis heme-transporting ATPase CcmA [Gammaproteobacteria bacterium]
MLELKKLSCERNDRVLFENLSLLVESGDVVQISGSNGSGKTSLLRVICGLNDYFTGGVFWKGEMRDSDVEAFRNDLLFLGHRVGLSKLLSPIENLKWSTGGKTDWSEKDLLQALSRNGLQGFEYQPCFLLSAGQQQRAALSKLYLSNEPMWILDEPFNALDSEAIDMLENLIMQHARRGGIVLVTTHHKLKIPSLRTVDLS